MIHMLNMELERAVWEEDVLGNKKGSRCGNCSQEWEDLWWKGADIQWSMRSLNGIKARDHQGDRCEVNVRKPSQSIKQSHLAKEGDVLICEELTDRLWWTHCPGQGIRRAHPSPSSLVRQVDTVGVCRKYTLVRTVVTREDFKETKKNWVRASVRAELAKKTREDTPREGKIHTQPALTALHTPIISYNFLSKEQAFLL